MNKFLVSATPHIRKSNSITMQDAFIILALLPSVCCSIIYYNLAAFWILMVSSICCYLFDVCFSYIIIGKFDVRDISSVVTGMVLGLCMPVNISLWYVVLASFFAVFIGKILFGGQGRSLFNEPALGVALISAVITGFSTSLCAYFNVEGVFLDSPLNVFVAGDYTAIPIFNLFMGNAGGLIGTTSAIAIIIGGVFLMITNVYDFYIPIISIVSFVVTIIITKGVTAFLPELLAGSFLFVSFFLLPSHTSSPTIWISKCFYAIIFGVLAGLVRINYILGEAGVFFCLLLCNLITSVLDSLFSYFYRGRGLKKYE